MAKRFIPCTMKQLYDSVAFIGAQTAMAVSPYNQLMPGTPAKIAVYTSRYWGPEGVDLTVSFLDGAPADLQARIVSHLNAAGEFANIRFRLVARDAQVRIAREPDGYWSYLGTDILSIPRSRQTMNLEGFTMRTPEADFVRVVRHEGLHTCGCPHEHSRSAIVAKLHPARTIAYFRRTQGWSEQEVRQQILTPIPESQLTGSAAEEESLMAYWFPGECTIDGKPILGGKDFSQRDKDTLARIYPKTVSEDDLTVTISQPGTYKLVRQ